MAKTLLLDTVTGDLVVDAKGNIGVADVPYALAQDAASAIKLFRGELFYDTTRGVPYRSILGKLPPISLIKQLFVDAALTVPGITAATCYISGLSDRGVSGQIQVTDQNGNTSAAGF